MRTKDKKNLAVSKNEQPARLFVDMDGTVAEFVPTKEIETLYEKNYFLSLKPIMNTVNAVNNILSKQDIEVYVLSAFLSDSKYALSEKNQWLDKYLPCVDEQHRIFVPCGKSKRDFVPGGVSKSDFLLDDYTKNLNQWEKDGTGIKFVNSINDTNKSWPNDRVYFYNANLAEDITDIVKNGETAFDFFNEKEIEIG